MIYSVHPTDKWKNSKAKNITAKDSVWVTNLTHPKVPGLYEWMVSLESAVKSIVFYLGKDGLLRKRIKEERLNEGRNTSTGFLEFTELILKHILECSADEEFEKATFSCRIAQVGEVDLNKFESAVLSKFDYVCNDRDNDVTRVNFACESLGIKNKATRDAEEAAATEATTTEEVKYSQANVENALDGVHEVTADMKALITTKLKSSLKN